MTARIRFATSPAQAKKFDEIARSDALGDRLEELGKPVLDAAQRDSNPRYVATLRLRRHISQGHRGRVSVRIGADNLIGPRVEAKRGTLARAMTSAGL